MVEVRGGTGGVLQAVRNIAKTEATSPSARLSSEIRC